MSDRPTRVIGLLCVLLGVWIATYWLYQPVGGAGAAGRITLEDGGPRGDSDLKSEMSNLKFEMPDARPAPGPSAPPSASQPSATEPSKPLAPGTRRVQKIAEPLFREYMVQPGDISYERIAARAEVFGDARLSPAIARSNPWVSPDRLKPGITVLKIPLDPENVQGKVVWVEEAGGESAKLKAQSSNADPVGGEPVSKPEVVEAKLPPPPSDIAHPTSDIAKTYVIQTGDTLWDLSKKFYGKGAHWKRLAEANRDVIPNPDHPPVGVTIRIPPEP